MTTLIQQLGPSDCVLASIAMAAGCAAHSDLWKPEDVEFCVTNKGIGDIEPWMERAGFKEKVHYIGVYLYSQSQDDVKRMLWGRRALLSVASLNNKDGSHMVFWDGLKLWDPHEGHYPEYLAFRHLSTCCITRAYVFNEVNHG